MITIDEVKQAESKIKECQKIINDYHTEQKIISLTKQKEREDNCGDHYYIATNSKWQPEGQMRCSHCGKTIN